MRKHGQDPNCGVGAGTTQRGVVFGSYLVMLSVYTWFCSGVTSDSSLGDHICDAGNLTRVLAIAFTDKVNAFKSFTDRVNAFKSSTISPTP